jgi:hypothetical protein
MSQEKGPEKKPEAEVPESEKPFHLEVSAGDRVKITAEALVDPEAQIATPLKLFKFGWPNDFLVLDVYDDEKYGQVIALDPCCSWIKDPEKHQKLVCKAHTTRFFEVIERAHTTDPNRRYSGVNIAGLDILSVEYLNGGENPALAVRVAGRKPIILNGQPAHILSQFLRAQKVF